MSKLNDMVDTVLGAAMIGGMGLTLLAGAYIAVDEAAEYLTPKEPVELKLPKIDQSSQSIQYYNKGHSYGVLTDTNGDGKYDIREAVSVSEDGMSFKKYGSYTQDAQIPQALPKYFKMRDADLGTHFWSGN